MTKKNSSSKGLKDGTTRYTFIIDENQLEIIKATSFYDRKSLKDFIHSVLSDYIFRRKDDLAKIMALYKESQ